MTMTVARTEKPITALHRRLREFRLAWEAKGGTRGTLRRERKAQGHVLFPKFR
ncbi:MAG: hypothetical protein AB7L09_02000 [Nitrospira sp.]